MQSDVLLTQIRHPPLLEPEELQSVVHAPDDEGNNQKHSDVIRQPADANTPSGSRRELGGDSIRRHQAAVESSVEIQSDAIRGHRCNQTPSGLRRELDREIFGR